MPDRADGTLFPNIPHLPAVENEAIGAHDSDSVAHLETRSLTSAQSSAALARHAEMNDRNRSEKFKDHFERIALVALYLLAVLTGVLGAIWAWHIIMPSSVRWLGDVDVSRIQHILTGGALLSLLGDQFRRRLGSGAS